MNSVGLIGDIIYWLCWLFVWTVVNVFSLVAGPIGYAAGRTVRLYRRLRSIVAPVAKKRGPYKKRVS